MVAAGARLSRLSGSLGVFLFPGVGKGHAGSFLEPAAFSLMLTVKDIEAWWRRAIAAGCTVRTPPQEMFWGDTFGEAVDPFGVTWSLNQPA